MKIFLLTLFSLKWYKLSVLLKILICWSICPPSQVTLKSSHTHIETDILIPHKHKLERTKTWPTPSNVRDVAIQSLPFLNSSSNPIMYNVSSPSTIVAPNAVFPKILAECPRRDIGLSSFAPHAYFT